MCHFITLIAPTDQVEAIHMVMKRHERAAIPIDNPSVRKVLRQGEYQYLTTTRHCDCGTMLVARQETPEQLEIRLSKEAARMKRKGWSTTKIARAIEDRRKAETRPDDGRVDSLELWQAVLLDLHDMLDLPYAGLLVRFYAGAVAAEVFSAERREPSENANWLTMPAPLVQDEVTIISLT